ncbi:MAG: DUF4982 domain-containing protein [Atopobiaceae bacterium]|nr:DUF4982 domain-containing protein [Atopobiaceae bacterium]
MHRTPFNEDWVFYRDGSPNGTSVSLPHDAMIHAPRSADAPSTGEQGNFQGGTYRYEKRFSAPLEWAGTHVLLQFGGVYRHARVSLNGVEVGGCAYGWSPFFCDLSEALRPGEQNLLVVTCENAVQPDSRWYTGAGIHRPVWLWVGGHACIAPEGVRLRTVGIDPACVRVEVACDAGDVHTELLDGDEVVASVEGRHSLLRIPDAKLWSAEDPHLYTWRSTLSRDGVVLDAATGTFGIRELRWGTDGFFVNGERTLLRGGCIHADNGILGAAAWPEADRRRVLMLKEAGFNAIRSAHNPASDATVEACDEYGVYLLDEGWDQWFDHKNPYDYADEWRENHLADLDALVARDYNHPSVIMWSIGNEVSEPRCEEGLAAIERMVARLHEADPTRPVTCGVNLTILGSAAKGRAVYDAENGGMGEGGEASQTGLTSTTFNALSQVIGFGMNHMADLLSFDRACSPALDRLDIAGYNYARGRYVMDGRLHPQRVIVGTETLCGDVVRNYRAMQRLPYLVGDFVWAAWDYLGEAGCGAWTYGDSDRAFQKSYPWLLANQGALDILGDPNAEMLLAQAAWGMAYERPLIAVRPLGQGVAPARAAWRFSNGLPSWSWRGCEGEHATVEVFCSAPVVDLRLNGRSLGRKRSRGCICRWTVPYEPGELVATAVTARGEELGRTVLRSAGPARVRLEAERRVAEPGDLVYVRVLVSDDAGMVEMLDDRMLTAHVEGGELLAFGSARPRTEERYDVGAHTTYFGRAQAVVRMGTKDVTLVVRDERAGGREERVVIRVGA